MPGLPFTLRQLEVFSTLAATRSFRRCAERLGISQASVSNQVKTLETQLGFALFNRTPGRRPLLTSDGIAFQEDLRVFQRAAEALAAHRRASKDHEEPPLPCRILVGQGMFDTYVRPKLDRFLAGNPHVEVSFETKLPYGTLVNAIGGGEYAFALINQRTDQAMPEETRQLAIVRGGIYGHRKFAQGHSLPMRPEVLSTLPFIMAQARGAQGREVLRAYAAQGITPRHIAGHTQYFDVIAAMLERGLGVASFSEAILPASMRKDVILLRPMENWRLLFYRRDHGTEPRFDAVERFLISSVVDDPDYPAIQRTS